MCVSFVCQVFESLFWILLKGIPGVGYFLTTFLKQVLVFGTPNDLSWLLHHQAVGIFEVQCSSWGFD